jgi:hypothetical protein
LAKVFSDSYETYSDFPEVFAIPGDVTSKGTQFFNEAEALWKAEEGHPSLANIQALALMSHMCVCQLLSPFAGMPW